MYVCTCKVIYILKIIDFKKQKFLKECREYLKTSKVSDSLSMTINNTTPGHIEFLKSDLSDNDKIIVDTVVSKIKILYRKSITSNRQKSNMLAASALENLSTLNEAFVIKRVMERYRESINPVKALYYDLQEIMFLYNGKTKKDHHIYLMNMFSTVDDFSDLIMAIDKDVEDLNACKLQLNGVASTQSIANSGEYVKRLFDTHDQLIQWKKLFIRFPHWVNDNKEDDSNSWLRNTLTHFFNSD